MITGFQEWATGANIVQKWPLSHLEGRAMCIDAELFINNLLNGSGTREPLLPALGGVPFSIQKYIDDQVQKIRDAKIKPLFVFNGLGVANQQKKLETSLKHHKNLDTAWELYNASEPSRAVDQFANSCTYDVENLYRHIQSYFHQKGIKFLVAPYSASAQLASMEMSGHVDVVWGSTEVLMFEVEKAIIDIDFANKEFSAVFRRSCIEALTPGSPGLFLDACLLAGSSFLRILPQIDNDLSPQPKLPKIRAAAELLKRTSLTADQFCLQNQDDLLMQQFGYPDLYRKAFMSIKHHVVMTPDGKIETLQSASAPNDVHTFVGQRLPDEVIFYQSRGIIGPRVLTWRTTSEILETPPLDGGSSITYQVLVKDQLLPQRLQALSLLSYSLHRFYQHNDVDLKCWFSMDQKKTISISDAADPKMAVADWNVRIEAISEKVKALNQNASSLVFAIESLKDSEFAKKTITKRADPSKGDGQSRLTTVDEICSNSLWRFLSLRGYVAKDHSLTPLGNCLATAFDAASKGTLAQTDYEEPIFKAVELLRLNLLTSDNLFPVPPYHGAPYRGSEDDKRKALLISRVACLGSLQHKVDGYTGPLSRHLLAYQGIISAVRAAQRDVLEMSLCTVLLSGSADRNIKESDLQTASFKLPFIRDTDCALGIAVKSYLDELITIGEPTSDETKKTIYEKKSKIWFPHAVDFSGSMTDAFALWDAVYAAIKVAPDNLASKAMKEEWKSADEWLAGRR